MIDKFAGYGFNKSHAAAYALVAYQTAWLKAHHPVEFYAASMCFDMAQTDKLAIFVDDMRRMGTLCLPPSINASEAEFAVERTDDGLAVRYALGALKGVGEKAMEQLVEERRAHGPFRDLDDFAGRVDPRLLNRRQIESLAGGGAFDRISRPRRGVRRRRDHPRRRVERGRRAGQRPGRAVRRKARPTSCRSGCPAARPGPWPSAWPQEKESFGFYFSAHPVDHYRHLAEAHGARSFAELAAMPAPADGGRAGAMMAALVEEVRWRTSARGRRYMMATLSDASGQFEATVFDDQIAEQVAVAARAGTCALLNVELDRRPGEETPRVTIRSVSRSRACRSAAGCSSRSRSTAPKRSRRLAAAVAGERGGNGQLRLRTRFEGGEAELVLGRDFHLDAELAARLERLDGVAAVRLSVVEAPRLALVS